MENNSYAGVACASGVPKPISEHQSAIGRLDERIQELGKNIAMLILRLEPVSDPQEKANKASGEAFIAPAHNVPAIRDLNRLESYIEGHLRAVREAAERLAI